MSVQGSIISNYNLTTNTNQNLGNNIARLGIGHNVSVISNSYPTYLLAYILKSGSPTDNLVAYIYNKSDLTTPLYTSNNVDGATLTTGYTWINFTFSTNVTMNSGDYMIAVKRSAVADTSDYYQINTYQSAGSGEIAYQYNTNIWEGYYQRAYTKIILYGNNESTPPPSSSISFISPTPTSDAIYYVGNQDYINISTNISNFPNYNNTYIDFYIKMGGLGNLTINYTTQYTNVTSFYISNLDDKTYYYYAKANNLTNDIFTEVRNISFYDFYGGEFTNNDTINTQFKNITWSNVTVTNNLSNIIYYTLHLYNGSAIRLLYNGTNKYYNIDTYANNLNIGLDNVLLLSVADSLGVYTQINSQILNVTKNAQLNVTIYDIITNVSLSNFSANITDINGIMEYWNTTGNVLSIDIIKMMNYSLIIDNLNYVISNVTYNANNSIYQTLNTSLYKINSVYLTINDEASGNLLVNTSCNVTFTGTTIATTYNTTSGIIFLSNLTPDNYAVTFNCALYTSRQYFITVTNRSTQTLNAYLTQSAIQVLLSYSNKDTGQVLEGVNVALSKMINGSLTVVESRLTDVTGRTQFTVATGVAYTFTNTLSGYTTKIFTLNPVLFTSYNVQLTKSASSTVPMDLQSISVSFYPQSFVKENNTFTFIISSPNGTLTNYGYTLTTQCKNIATYNGVNVYGGSDVIIFNLSCASTYDTVNLFYYYQNSDGEQRNFTQIFGIVNIVGNNTISNTMNGATYGMGLFERVLISTVLTIILMGVVGMVGGMISGLVVGLFIQGYLVSVGFIPVSIVIITMFVGVLIIMSYNQR